MDLKIYPPILAQCFVHALILRGCRLSEPRAYEQKDNCNIRNKMMTIAGGNFSI